MTRIAYICADLGVPVFGYKGCSIHVQEVIRAFIQNGAEVTLITPRLGGDTPPGLKSVKVIRLPDKAFVDQSQREAHAQQLNEQITTALELAGPFDMIYERYSLWSYAAMEYAKVQGIPRVLEVNAPLIEEQAKHRQLINRDVADQAAHRVFAAASSLIAVSEGVATYLNTFPETNGRVSVIGNGVNPSRFPYPSKSTSKPENHYTIGFVGTLKPWHGLHDLIEAFVNLRHDVNQVRLLIVGDGPERDNLQNALQSQDMMHAVEFTGAVAPDQIPHHLAAMDIAVAPYPDSEQFYFSPLKVLEYMAAGLPVVASRIGQLTSLIQHNHNGILCTPGQPADLTRTLEHLMADACLRRRLGAEARRTVVQTHSWQTVAERIFSVADLAQQRQHYDAT